ncbi:MAG: hypothetical protein GEU75_12005 [Dehalococcoidia bacterium]|nr:hypothetical protein [Dehalococcoidia bacterium]
MDGIRRSTKHEAEMRWLAENEAMLEATYAGKWVAVKGDKLIGTGDSFGEASKAAEAQGIEEAVIASIKPREFQGVFLIR